MYHAERFTIKIQPNLLDINNILRIFGLLLLGYANFSLALGLGDIALRSHLGEPLAVSISVTDVEKLPDSACFTVKDNSETTAFKKVSAVFKQTAAGNKLYISTHEPINEPIINLHVSFNCETNLEREYVLLLDPAAITNPIDIENAATQSLTDLKKALAPETAENTSIAEPIAQATVIKKRNPKKKRVSAASEIDRKLMEAYTGKQQGASVQQDEPAQKGRISDKAGLKSAEKSVSASKPYLIISGGSTNSSEHGSLPDLALRLETQIDFSRAVAVSPMTTAEAIDEVTVMVNRLAHLEKQITSLQNRNAQLQSEAQKAKEDAKNARLFSEQQLSWLKYLLLGIGLLALFAGGEWIRRKAIRDRLDREETLWFQGNKPASSDASIFPLKALDKTDESLLDDTSFVDTLDNPLSGGNAGAVTLTENANDEHENVLENADVFIEHDRPALAIQLLQNHLGDFPSESPKIWLKLLSLIASEGTQAEYDQAVSDCKQFFNIKMPSFAEAGADDNSSIEDYPHILARLEGVWGTQYAVGFLNDLIYNQQSQPREGFSRGTFEELFFLKQVAEILNANTSKEQISLYKPATVKPKLENLAFNEEAFNDTKTEKPHDTLHEAKPLTTDLEDAKNVLDIPANLYNTNLEDSPFQDVPSYDVDLLADLDEVLNTKNTPDSNELLNNELIAGLDTPAPPVTQELAETLQAEEIKFPEPEFTAPELPGFADNENIFDISEPDTGSLNTEAEENSKPAKKSNVIEWDLPEKDK